MEMMGGRVREEGWKYGEMVDVVERRGVGGEKGLEGCVEGVEGSVASERGHERSGAVGGTEMRRRGDGVLDGSRADDRTIGEIEVDSGADAGV